MFSSKAFIALTVILFGVSPVIAATVTSYTDAGIVEDVVALKSGRGIFTLPPTAVEGSLRVSPLLSGVVDDVRVFPLQSDKASKRELSQLKEKRDALKDRLRAIAAKEGIFEKAAKSQSARAPKKTKTNPDPLATIRQGTDYAIAQLESIYRTRRKSEKELASVEGSIARLEGNHSISGSQVLVKSSNAFKVRVSYIDKNAGWTPSYRLDISKNGETVIRVISSPPSAVKSVSLSKLTDRGELFSVVKNKYIKEIRCSSKPVSTSAALLDPVELSPECSQNVELPSAQASCYIDGVYSGVTTFPGTSKGKTAPFICGGYSFDSSDNVKGATK